MQHTEEKSFEEKMLLEDFNGVKVYLARKDYLISNKFIIVECEDFRKTYVYHLGIKYHLINRFLGTLRHIIDTMDLAGGFDDVTEFLDMLEDDEEHYEKFVQIIEERC